MVPFLTLTVADAMTTEPVCVQPATALSELRELFARYQYNAFPVVEDTRLAGWITQFDFLRAFTLQPESIMPNYGAILSQAAASIMLRDPESVSPEQSLNRVLGRMIETRHKSFPVIADDGQLVGIIAREDIFRGLIEQIERS
jgi:CBS domain-containing protein